VCAGREGRAHLRRSPDEDSRRGVRTEARGRAAGPPGLACMRRAHAHEEVGKDDRDFATALCWTIIGRSDEVWSETIHAWLTRTALSHPHPREGEYTVYSGLRPERSERGGRGVRAGRAGVRDGPRARARASSPWGGPAMPPICVQSGAPAMTVSSTSREQVTRALSDVFDPELTMSVVDLGLVYGVEIDGARVRITMTLTTQGCPLHDSMTNWIRRAVGKIPGVRNVQVAIVFDPPWTPDRIRAGPSPRPFARRRGAAQPGTSLPCALMSRPMTGVIPSPHRRPHPGDKTRHRPGVLNLEFAVGALQTERPRGRPYGT
jgi:metal-sulfur cluster biosynthetic enzyme